MNNIELREKIRTIMINHLKEKGYVLPLHPIRGLNSLSRELKPLWIQIEIAGLIQPGWTYAEFCRIANHAAYTALGI